MNQPHAQPPRRQGPTRRRGPTDRDRALAEVAFRHADFDRLKAMMDAEVRQGDRRRVGALEALGVGLVGATLFATPIGPAMLEHVSALTSGFKTGATLDLDAPRISLAADPAAVAPATGEEAAEAAGGAATKAPKASPLRSALPRGLARAAAVVFADGIQVGYGKHYDVRLPKAARQALRSVGITVPARSASAAAREGALIAGLRRLVEELGSVEAALVALRVDRGQVENALDLAFGSNLRNPDRLDAFGRYLPPAARRAAEGPTRHVMALAVGYDMQWPVPEAARVSSGFGPRLHPVLGEDMWHGGTDLAVEQGTPIRAMADGHVLYSKRDYVNGKFVKLDHGYGLTSAYVHNSKLMVRPGERVQKGQIIALSGQTGRATGPHLHFQVEIDDRPIDPEAFRERKAPRAHRRSIEAEAIGDADLPR